MTACQVRVGEVKAGDVFKGADGEVFWEAVEDAKIASGGATLVVRYVDGGLGERVWDSAFHPFTVHREDPVDSVA